MIASLRGEVASVGLDHAVIDVGGVGYAVRATPATLAGLPPGEQASLATSLVVKEDALTLYGFADEAARDLFTLLQTVSGVGPRIALAMLAVLDPDVLTTAVAESNLAVLTQVPGIGKKGAERLVIELRDKIGAPAGAGGAAGRAVAPRPGVREPVVEALTGLGFATKQAEQAVDAVLAERQDGEEADTSLVLRQALTALGRKK
jgi:Holliday junction DNA helicase RuvA